MAFAPRVQKVMIQPINLIFRLVFNVFSSLIFPLARCIIFRVDTIVTDQLLGRNIFSFFCRYLQSRSRVSIWLFENVNERIEGQIIGFDEYMNLVLDEGEEVNIKTGKRMPLGRLLLKGDSVTLIQNISDSGK